MISFLKNAMASGGSSRPMARWTVDFRFNGFQAFSEGLATVQVGERWGFIDRRGRLVIPAQFKDGWATPPGVRGRQR